MKSRGRDRTRLDPGDCIEGSVCTRIGTRSTLSEFRGGNARWYRDSLRCAFASANRGIIRISRGFSPCRYHRDPTDRSLINREKNYNERGIISAQSRGSGGSGGGGGGGGGYYAGIFRNKQQ